MLPDPNRRRFLFVTCGGIGASMTQTGLGGLFGAAFAQPSPASMATFQLRANLMLITGAGGNVVLLDDPDGAVMVDSGSSEHSAALAEYVAARLRGEAVSVLFNTHWHPAHTGANEAFAATGARIVAHENTRLWMGTEYYVDWQDRTYRPRPAAALPTETFYSSDPQPITISLGSEQIEYGHLREAHTDGDIYVLFRANNVLVAGGAVSVGAYPILDYATGGWIGGLVDATARLLRLADADTLVVPGTGPAQTRAHLQAQHEMLTTVRGRVENLMRKGSSIEEMLAAGITAEFDAKWGANRERFITNIYNGLWWQGRLDGSL